MVRTLRTAVAGAAWLLAVLGALSFSVSPALALTGSAPIVVEDMDVSLDGPVGLSDGGTNANVTGAAGAIIYHNGTAFVATTTVGTSGQCVKSAAGAEPTFGDCVTTDANTQIKAIVGFGSGMKITGGNTAYIWPGLVDGTEGNVMAPTQGATFTNLNCHSSADPGGSETYTITLGAGACSGALTYSATIEAEITAGNQEDNSTGTYAASSGDCIAIKLVTSASAADAYISCTMERSDAA